VGNINIIIFFFSIFEQLNVNVNNECYIKVLNSCFLLEIYFVGTKDLFSHGSVPGLRWTSNI